jgi:hypothetical protein
MEMPFCINCGRELTSGESLCRHCGDSGKIYVPATDGAAAAGRQKGALMVLCGDRSLGLFKRIKAYAVFFRDRVVFAHLSREREKAEGKAMLRGLKNKEHSLLQNIVNRFNLWIYYGERYYDMNVESMLNENPSNFSIPNDEVSEFFFKASQEDADTDESGSWIGEIVIRSAGGETVDICHNYRDSNNKIKGILRDLYGDRLIYRESEVMVYPGEGQAYNSRRFY